MALPEWMRVSVDAVSMARRLRQSGRQDLIDAVERGDMSLQAAVAQLSEPTSSDIKGET
jgi:hypothetical protein